MYFITIILSLWFLCQCYLFQNHIFQMFISARYLEFLLYIEFLKLYQVIHEFR